MQYHSIFSFGDSFTFGTDLEDCDATRFSENTWPGLLAEKERVRYRCYATGGIGNQQIAYRVIREYNISKNKERNFYIINWTWIERFDYINTITDDWSVIHPRHDDKVSHFFYKNLDSQAWNMVRNLQIIWSTISFLKEHRCRFLMTMLDETIWAEEYPSKHVSIISPLQNLVRPYITDFNGQTFLDWSDSNGFARGKTDHPLEDAHKEASILMYPEFKQKFV